MPITSLRLASLPLPPRALPVHRKKPVVRAAAGRLLFIDKATAAQVAGESGALPRISAMPFECPVLVVGTGVSPFRAEHVAAALKARGASGYWLVEKQQRPRATGNGAVAETLVGFPGLHIERIGSPRDL